MRYRRVLLAVLGITFCPVVCFGDLSEPGPFSAGSTTVTIARPDSSTFSALLYYPATGGGPGAPRKTGASPCSAVMFGHGFLRQPSRYFATLEHLATYGHLVIATTSQTGLSPNHSRFAEDMRLTLDHLTSFFGLYLRNDQSLWRNVWGPEAFAKTGLPTRADPGVRLAAEAPRQSAPPWHRATFRSTLTNTGPTRDSFSFFAEDNDWDILSLIQETPILAPAEQFQFSLDVTIPAAASAGETDTILLSARSNEDGATRGHVRLEAVAVREPVGFAAAMFPVLLLAMLHRARNAARIR